MMFLSGKDSCNLNVNNFFAYKEAVYNRKKKDKEIVSITNGFGNQTEPILNELESIDLNQIKNTESKKIMWHGNIAIVIQLFLINQWEKKIHQ